MQSSTRRLFGPGMIIIVIVALFALCLPDQARAEHGGYDLQEDGVYLRTQLGFGVLLENRESILRTEDDVTLAWEVALGGFVAPKFAIHGTFFGWGVFDERRDDPDDFFRRDSAFSATQIGFGPGVTVYLGDSGVYFTGSGGISLLWREVGFDDEDRDLSTGFGFEAMIGKEWWNDFVGVGLSVGYMAHIDTEVAERTEFGGGSLGLHFSLSFND